MLFPRPKRPSKYTKNTTVKEVESDFNYTSLNRHIDIYIYLKNEWHLNG